MNKHKGFTIVELLIVIVIVGILAGVTVVAYNGISAKAYDAKKLAEINQFKKQLAIYQQENGCLPLRCKGDSYGSYKEAYVINAKSGKTIDALPGNPSRNTAKISPETFKQKYDIDIPPGSMYRSYSGLLYIGRLSYLIVNFKDYNNIPKEYRASYEGVDESLDNAHYATDWMYTYLKSWYGITYSASKRALVCDDGSVAATVPMKASPDSHGGEYMGVFYGDESHAYITGNSGSQALGFNIYRLPNGDYCNKTINGYNYQLRYPIYRNGVTNAPKSAIIITDHI